MIVALEVHTRDPGGLLLARTTIAIDGSVVTAIRRELLDAPSALREHLDEVGRRLREWQYRIRRMGEALLYVDPAMRVGMASFLVAAGYATLSHGVVLEIVGWGAGAVVCEGLRRGLPTVVRWLMRRWLGKI